MPVNTHGGGANTNVNGLSFEQTTKLSTALESVGCDIQAVSTSVVKTGKNKIQEVLYQGTHIGFACAQHAFEKYLSHYQDVDMKTVLSKSLRPDDVFINDITKTVYIIEKKFQHDSGSVDEKLQTCDFKKKQYKKLLRTAEYDVEYYYVCNDWFAGREYADVREYIEDVGCKIFFNEIPLDYLGLGGCTDEIR